MVALKVALFLALSFAILEAKPINYHLRNSEHPVTGVKFNRLGYPIFESKFNCRLPFHLIRASDIEQFRYCTNKLREAIKKDPSLKKDFTQAQLKAINSKSPTIDKFTWHHHQAKSKRLLQLVDREIHNKTAHSGGRAVYGGGKLGRVGKFSGIYQSSIIYRSKIKNFRDYERVGKSLNKRVVVAPALLSKDGSKFITSIKSGALSGLAVIAIDGGLAYYDYAKGNILKQDFEERLKESIVKGSFVGGSEGVALFFLSTPNGLVLFAIGVGSYILVDTALDKLKEIRQRHLLSADDLRVYGIEIDSILDINDKNIPLNVENW